MNYAGNVTAPWWVGGWPFFNILLMLIFMGVGIYALFIFIKLMRKGLEALDIYIQKNRGL